MKFLHSEKHLNTLKPVLFLLLAAALLASCSKKDPAASPAELNPYYQPASDFLQQGKSDSAFVYFTKAKDWYLSRQDSVGAGVSMINLAQILTNVGDRFGGQELSLEAVAFFDEDNEQHYPYLLSIYNNLGIASYALKEYQKAIEFYTKCEQFVTDSARMRVLRNNIANAYRKDGRIDEAIEQYRAILDQEKDTLNRARVLSNYSYARWQADPKFDPEPGFRQALKDRAGLNNLSAMNSSYAHLADYFMKRNTDSALAYSKKMYEASKVLRAPQDELEALQKLIPLSSADESKKYFLRYQTLDDSLQNAWQRAKNQFAVIRFETEKHKAEKFQLAQESTIRRLWVISLSVILVIILVMGTMLYRRRMKQMALKAEAKLRESQLKTSKKVHDVVANGLYRLMSEIENNDDLEKDSVLDDLEDLYEQSRDISYDHEPVLRYGSDFRGQISELLSSFSSEDRRVVIVGNEPSIWLDVTEVIWNELHCVIQELMVNMTRHSEASSVVLRFERNEEGLQINYKDNGLGFADGQKFKNGLNSINSRIKTVGGDIEFGKPEGGGLTVLIRVPVKPHT